MDARQNGGEAQKNHRPYRFTTYGNDKNSNRISCALPNGLVTTSGFDALNRVTSMVNQSGATTVYSVAYGYDLVGNRLTINETVKKSGSGSTTRNLEYDYDAQYRLTSESWYEGNKLKKYDYQYDLAGNRTNMVYTFHNSVTTTTYTHDVLNRLNTTTTAGKTVTYNYDLNGNRISKVGSHPSLPKHYYTFDTLNRLIQTRDGSTNGPVIFSATYDYRTRRLTTTESGATKYFRYDSGDSFHEVANGTSNIQVEFVRGSGMGGGIGSILYSDRGATREHFTYNAVGHTVALTLQTGAVSKSDLYEAYGNIVASTGSSSNNRLANTKERSFTLGLDNHGFRYYDPEVGRYISRDPIGYGDGLNVYLYVHNNPINHIDPLGLSEQEDKSDYAQGGLTARLLRWSSNKLNQIGTDSKSNAILSNPATQAVMGFYSHMASLGANVMTPKTYVEGYKTQVEKTSDVIFTAQQQGANPVSAASQGLGYAAGNLIGYTPAIESAFGVDIASGENIEGVDRAQRGLMGGSQLLLTGTGLAASYNAALQTGKIAASSELGESGLAAMRRTVAEAGNDIPVPTGTTGIRTIMSDLTASTGNEVALFRLFSGERVIRMGGPRSVPVGSDVSRIIAHTHPSGRLALSSADINAVQNLGGKSTVIIDPKSDIGARISINKP
jgi:RHS repeat-associated protein